MVQNCFSHVCSTDSSSCSEQKNWKKTRLKQGRKTKEGNQNIVVVTNSPGSSSLYCRTDIAPLLLRYCSAVALISLHCHSVVAPLSQRYRTATFPLSLRRCFSVVALLSQRYHTGIPPLSLRCCLSYCRYAVAPLLHRRRAVVQQQPLRPREGINNTILNCCCSTVTPLSLLLSIGRFTRLLPQEA